MPGNVHLMYLVCNLWRICKFSEQQLCSNVGLLKTFLEKFFFSFPNRKDTQGNRIDSRLKIKVIY